MELPKDPNPNNANPQWDLCTGGGGISSSSNPYGSAPSSPGGRAPHSCGYFYSAPASPVHFLLSTSIRASSPTSSASPDDSFEFSGDAAAAEADGEMARMVSADELFLNGQIRAMRFDAHLQRSWRLDPLLNVAEDDGEAEERPAVGVRGRDLGLRSGSMRRRARSMSPERSGSFEWRDEGADPGGTGQDPKQWEEAPTPSVSASSSRSSSTSSSSSSGRNSKRWVFLKEFLHRSKSEGSGSAKDRFWQSISFSPAKDRGFFFLSTSKDKSKNASAPPQHHSAVAGESKGQDQQQKQGTGPAQQPSPTTKRKAARGRRSAHEKHYAAKRAEAEEMRRRTFLPYRQGLLLGCLGFPSRGYGAMNGLARTLKAVSSR